MSFTIDCKNQNSDPRKVVHVLDQRCALQVVSVPSIPHTRSLGGIASFDEGSDYLPASIVT